MKTINYSSFFYFERKQLEEYLNDQALLGYHIQEKKLAKLKYEPEKQCYYHVNAQTKRRFFSQVTPNDDYIEIFESEGYHFLGNVQYFNIFMSDKKESIFSDYNEDIHVKDAFRFDMKYAFLNTLSFLLVIVLYLLSLLFGNHSLIDIFINVAILLWLIGFVLRNIYPVIKYKKIKYVGYNYIWIFKRNMICRVLQSFFYVSILTNYLSLGISFLLIFFVGLLGILIYICKIDSVEKIEKIDKYMTAGILILLIIQVFILK